MRQLLKTTATFLAVYFVLLLLLHLFEGKKQFAQLYQKQTSTLFSSFGNGGKVSVKHFKDLQGKFDTRYTLSSKYQIENAKAGALKKGLKTVDIQIVSFPINTWNFAGIFFLFYFALIMASPISLKQKILPLVLGFLIIIGFVLFKQWFSLFLKFSEFYDRFHVGTTNQTLIGLFRHFFNVILFPFFGLMISGLLWFFFCFERVKKQIISNKI